MDDDDDRLLSNMAPRRCICTDVSQVVAAPFLGCSVRMYYTNI
jgi:nitrate reductase cytochrome c-type subunit